MNYIYTLSSSEFPDIVKYIGYTNNIARRLNKHNHSYKHVSTKNSCWIKSVHNKGYSVVLEVIDESPSDTCIKELERHYIKMFKSFGAKLKILTDGGEGTTGYKHTKEAILKISEASKNRKKVDKPKKEKKILNSRIIDEDKKNLIESLYLQGNTKKSISIFLNISEYSVHNILLNKGYNKIRKETNISYEYLYELYITNNLTKKEIANITNFSERMIKKRLSDYKIKKPKEILIVLQNRIHNRQK